MHDEYQRETLFDAGSLQSGPASNVAASACRQMGASLTMGLAKYCMSRVAGRGAGLGNELIPWARAHLMSQVLGVPCLKPAFGINARNYSSHFRTSRLDFLRQRVLARVLPTVHFGEAEFDKFGGDDVVQAFTRYALHHDLHRRSALLVTTDGMWGGLQHIARARHFVRGLLYGSRYAAKNLALLGSRLHPDRFTVAFHVRLGDFSQAQTDLESYRGKFNCSLPMDWYLAVAEQLQRSFGGQLQFQVFSDGSAEQLAPLVRLLKPIDTRSGLPSDVSDLLAMSHADLLVCSVSSYSLWAATLSAAPYIWFGPQMHTHEGGWLSVWGNQTSQQRADSHTLQSLAVQAQRPPLSPVGRGHAVGINGELPPPLVHSIQRRLEELNRHGDLVRCGVARNPGYTPP